MAPVGSISGALVAAFTEGDLSRLAGGQIEHLDVESRTGACRERDLVERRRRPGRPIGVRLAGQPAEVQPIRADDVTIEPDLSNAGPFLAAALLAGGTVTVEGWPAETTQVGEEFLTLLPRLGATTVLVRRNAIIVFMGVELMLNATNLLLVTFSRLHGNLTGQVLAFFVMVVAAAEVVIGLAIIISIFRTRRSASVDDVNLLKG